MPHAAGRDRVAPGLRRQRGRGEGMGGPDAPALWRHPGLRRATIAARAPARGDPMRGGWPRAAPGPSARGGWIVPSGPAVVCKAGVQVARAGWASASPAQAGRPSGVRAFAAAARGGSPCVSTGRWAWGRRGAGGGGLGVQAIARDQRGQGLRIRLGHGRLGCLPRGGTPGSPWSRGAERFWSVAWL